MPEPTYNRPDMYRLKRVSARVEKALDELSRAQGETRPSQFADIRKSLTTAIAGLEKLATQLDEIGVAPEPELPDDEVDEPNGERLSADDLDDETTGEAA